MSKIKMKYKEISKRVTQFAMLDISNIKEGEAKQNARAFQRFIEYMVIPAGLKEYTDEMLGIYILEALVRADIGKKKDEKDIGKVEKLYKNASKKFVAQRKREGIINRIKQSFLEWHCILEQHMWEEKDGKKQCSRCKKIREI